MDGVERNTLMTRVTHSRHPVRWAGPRRLYRLEFLRSASGHQSRDDQGAPDHGQADAHDARTASTTYSTPAVTASAYAAYAAAAAPTPHQPRLRRASERLVGLVSHRLRLQLRVGRAYR